MLGSLAGAIRRTHDRLHAGELLRDIEPHPDYDAYLIGLGQKVIDIAQTRQQFEAIVGGSEANEGFTPEVASSTVDFSAIRQSVFDTVDRIHIERHGYKFHSPLHFTGKIIDYAIYDNLMQPTDRQQPTVGIQDW